MAVFGNLAEFPLLEVVSMLEQRCGVLRFSKIGRFESLEFHLNNSELQGLVVDGRVMRDGFAAKDIVVEIANARDGQFEFQRVPVTSPSLLNDLSIRISEVLLRRATLDDEWNKYKQNLPDIETRFVLSSQELIWLDGDLQNFWQQVEPLLEYGSSAKDLALRLSLDLQAVQLNLYKLRTIGIIRPARKAQEVADIRAGNFPSRDVPAPTKKRSSMQTETGTPMYLPRAPKPPAKPTLISRLLGALRWVGKPP